MIACLRRFDNCPRGCRWTEVTSENEEMTSVVEDKMRRVALQFLATLSPEDVYYIHTEPNVVTVYYRREK